MASHRRVAVVDGANIAYLEKTQDGKPRVSNIIAVRKALEKRGFDPIVIIDASLKYEVDDPAQLEGLIDNLKVRQVPAQTDADYFVLETARNEDGLVVTNDLYAPYEDQFPWAEERRIPVMIVRGEVELYEKKLQEIQDGHREKSKLR